MPQSSQVPSGPRSKTGIAGVAGPGDQVVRGRDAEVPGGVLVPVAARVHHVPQAVVAEDAVGGHRQPFPASRLAHAEHDLPPGMVEAVGVGRTHHADVRAAAGVQRGVEQPVLAGVEDHLRRGRERREQRPVTPALEAQSVVRHRQTDALDRVPPTAPRGTRPLLRYRRVIEQEPAVRHHDRGIEGAQVVEAAGRARPGHGVAGVLLPGHPVEPVHRAGEQPDRRVDDAVFLLGVAPEVEPPFVADADHVGIGGHEVVPGARHHGDHRIRRVPSKAHAAAPGR